MWDKAVSGKGMSYFLPYMGEDAGFLADNFMKETKAPGENEDYWFQQAQSLLTKIIEKVQATKGHAGTWDDVMEITNSLYLINKNEASVYQKSAYQEFLQLNHEVKEGIITTLVAKLQLVPERDSEICISN